MPSDCDFKSGVDSLPFSLCREQKMLAFSQVLKPINWQDLLEEGNRTYLTLKMAFAQVVKHQLPTAVILRTPVTQIIIFNQGILLSQCSP